MPFTSLSRDAGTALQMNRGTCRLFELQKYCDHDMKSESPVDAPECPLACQRPGCQPTPAAPAQANLEKAATTLNETRIPRAGSGYVRCALNAVAPGYAVPRRGAGSPRRRGDPALSSLAEAIRKAAYTRVL